jgi:peptidoglycan/xylan/chitin deacetylase (PgdA/CDA1 family)
MTRRAALLALCAVVAGCGGGPLGVELGAADRERWSPGPPRREAIPVLAYHGAASADAFARHMVLLRHAGYQTVSLETFVRFTRGERVALPPRPFLLTFDDGRAGVTAASDDVLRELDLQAALFVDVGRVVDGDPEYLSWRALADLQRSGRWDVQLQAGTGKHVMRWGPSPRDVGSFYAYRGADEVLGGWRERVFGDLSWAERQLAFRVPGYRPLAFSPPYGNYGQVGTNDPEIPRLLLVRLQKSFPVVFTRDRPALVAPGTTGPIGRLDMTLPGAEGALLSLVR